MIDFYKELFEALPHNYFLIEGDERFKIVAASNKHLASVGRKREDVIGKGVFEAFPEDETSNFKSVDKLKDSFRTVIKERVSNIVMLQYDVPVGNGYEFRYWSVENFPFVINGKLYIINNATDVTPMFRIMGASQIK